MSTILLPRERVRMAIEHQQPDRPPIQFYAMSEVKTMLVDRFKGQNPEKVFQVDFRTVGPTSLRQLTKPIPGSGIDEYDIWGTGYRKSFCHSDVTGLKGTYLETVYLPFANFQTMDDVAAYRWPMVDDFDFSTMPSEIESNRDFAIILTNPSDIINGVGTRGLGLAQLLEDLALDDEVGISLIEGRFDFCLRHLRRGLEVGQGKIDIVYFADDFGTQEGLLISPEMFDTFFRSKYEELFDLAHSYGARAWLHSCGSTYALHSRFIEMGLDVLDSVQTKAANMDPELLKSEFGDKLTYCGMIDTQGVLRFGTVEECRRLARHRIEVVGKEGGYIFAPSHEIQIDCPLENILAIYEEVTGRHFA